MSVIEDGTTAQAPPVLAVPHPPQGRIPLRQFVRVLRQIPRHLRRRGLQRRHYRAHSLAAHVLLNEPGAIRYVLLDNAANYIKSEVGRRLLEPGLGRGLLTSEGETWRRHRRIMAPSFDPRSIAGYAPIMTEVTQGLLEKWDALPDGSELDVAAAMMHVTLHIISRAMFSSDSDEIVDAVEGGVTVSDTGAARPARPPAASRNGSRGCSRRRAGPLRRVRPEGRSALTERGRARTANRKIYWRGSLPRATTETGGGMTAKEVRDQVVTISWLGTRPRRSRCPGPGICSRSIRRLKRNSTRARGVLGGRTPRNEDIANLPYTRMVIEESMRLYPPAHTRARSRFGRDEMLGHRIPAGAEVLIVPWLLHRKPQLWEEPERFDPERFAPEPPPSGRASPTSRSAPGRASASAPRSPWPKRC